MPFNLLITYKNRLSIFLFLGCFLSPVCFSAAPASFESALKSFHAHKYDETIIHLKNALKDNLEHIPSRLLLAETLIAQGQGAMAETELGDLQAEGVDINQLVVLQAQAFLLQNKYQHVLTDITAGYRGVAIESKIQLYRGRAYLAINQLRDAETAFINALGLDPDMQLAKLGRAQIAINKNQLDRAMRFVDNALSAYEPLVNAWVMKANIAQLQANQTLALHAIEKALAIDPEHIQARLYRAAILIAQQKPVEAEPDLDFILAEIPLEPRAKYLKAIVNASLGNNKESAEKMAEVVETLNAILPEVMAENPSYYYLAGLTNFQFGNLDEAERNIRNFLKVKESDLNALRLMAMIELNTKNYIGAKARLTKTNVYFPNNVSVLTLLGITSMKLDDYESAQRYFKQVIDLKPEQTTDALENLARSKMATGNYHEAIDHLLTLNNATTESSVILMLVESYIKSKQFNKAKLLTLKLINKFPNNGFIAKQHAITLGLNEEREQARVFFSKALQLNEQDIDAAIYIARMDVVDQKIDAALLRITTLLERNKNNLHLQHELANIYARTGDKATAHTWFEKAYATHNNNEIALSKLVGSYVETQQLDKAVTTLESYISNNRNAEEARLILGQLYLSKNQPQKAIKTFQRLVKSELNKARVYMLLTKAYLSVDDRDAAVLALNKTIAWDNKRIDAREMLFILSLQLGDVATARDMVSDIKSLLPNTVLPALLAGDLAMHTKNYTQAEKHYRKAYKVKANQKAVLKLYDALVNLKRFSQARKAIKQWLSIQPNDVIADIAIAESYVLAKKSKTAITAYEQLIIQYKRMPILLNNLANIYVADNQIAKALPLAQEAYKKAPKNVNIIDTLAWTTSLAGDYVKALPLFREALVLDFRNPEVKYHLALTLDKENRRTEAKKLLIEAVQSGIEFGDKAQAKTQLNQWLPK